MVTSVIKLVAARLDNEDDDEHLTPEEAQFVEFLEALAAAEATAPASAGGTS